MKTWPVVTEKRGIPNVPGNQASLGGRILGTGQDHTRILALGQENQVYGPQSNGVVSSSHGQILLQPPVLSCLPAEQLTTHSAVMVRPGLNLILHPPFLHGGAGHPPLGCINRNSKGIKIDFEVLVQRPIRKSIIDEAHAMFSLTNRSSIARLRSCASALRKSKTCRAC